MAVILMESTSVIRVVRSLTSWYGVIAKTIAVFCGTTVQYHSPSNNLVLAENVKLVGVSVKTVVLY
jgi:hypothetical protein